jgi:hypothetical protein
MKTKFGMFNPSVEIITNNKPTSQFSRFLMSLQDNSGNMYKEINALKSEIDKLRANLDTIIENNGDDNGTSS